MVSVEAQDAWAICDRDMVDETQFIICDPGCNKVVVTKRRGVWSLPQGYDGGTLYRTIPNLREMVQEMFGIESHFTILLCVWRKMSEQKERDNILYEVERCVMVLEYHEHLADLPKDYEWVGIGEAEIHHCEEGVAQIIQEELAILSGGAPQRERRVPWGRLGWYAKTSAWMSEELGARGCVVSHPIVQVAMTQFGTVLKARTDCGDYYLKCTPEFCNEAAITEAMSSVAPQHVTAAFISKKEECLMITEEYGELLSTIKLDESEKVRYPKDYASMQKLSTQKLGELREAGVPVYEVEWMADNLDYLFNHKELQYLKDSDDLRGLKMAAGKIRHELQEFQELSRGLPLTIAHNDLYGGSNSHRDKGSSGPFKFYDWDCAVICNPFLDSNVDKRNEEYLEEWVEFKSMENLKKIAEQGETLEILVEAFRSLFEICQVEQNARHESRFCLEGELAQLKSHFQCS